NARIVFLDVQFQHATNGHVIEGGDNLDHLAGICAVGQHAVDQPGNLGAQADECAQVGRGADGPGQVYQVHSLQGEQVSFGYHANQFALFINHANVGEMVF